MIRQQIADLQIDIEAMRLGALRALTATMKTRDPGPRGLAAEVAVGRLNQALTELARTCSAPRGCASDTDWTYRFLRSRANSIEGGTTEMLKNIIAERVLGLPRLR